MDTLTSQFKNIFARFSQRDSYERHGLSPSRDWLVILLSTVVALVVCGLVALYVYFQVTNGTFFPLQESDRKPAIILDTTFLQETVKEISARRAASVPSQEQMSSLADPSL